jgi:hypothetical protein
VEEQSDRVWGLGLGARGWGLGGRGSGFGTRPGGTIVVQRDRIAVGQRNLVQARVAFESMREITADNRLQMAAANEWVWAEEWKIERHEEWLR